MADFKIDGFEELDKAFEKMSKPQYFMVKAVDAAAPKLVKAAEEEVKKAGGSHKLARSFKATDAKENKYGVFSVVRPVGRHHEKMNYVQEAAYLEYGTVWPKKQADAEKIHHGKQAGMPKNDAHPWRDKSINKAKSQCEEAMANAVFSEIDKMWR